MKNPFAMMAMMAAAMTAAFRENAYRDAGMALPKGKTRSRTPGKPNAAGTKQIIRFFKAKHGSKPDSVEEAREWYAGYLKEQDANVRANDRKRRIARIQRNHPWLAEWPTVKRAA